MKHAILVTGGAGFIGTHLLQKLSAPGTHRLISIDYREPKNPVPGVDYRRTDVRDLSAFKVEGTVETIYNFAAIHTTPGHPFHEYYETNVLGALEITALAERVGCNDIVFTSSISVYGPGEDTKTETTPLTPASAYGWSKMLAERVHEKWLDRDPARRLVVCRPAVIFGPGEGGNFTRLAKLMKRGMFVYPGRRDTIKACFYVEDLVAALFYAHDRGDRYVLFNGCYPDRYTLEQIIETFRAKHFSGAKTVTLPRQAVTAAASALKPFSAMGLGIHPDRVTKLIRSTDVVPGWLSAEGFAKSGQLPSALDRWAAATNGRFD